MSLCVSQKCSAALSLVRVKLLVHFIHEQCHFVTFVVRSHALFKLLNHVTDNIVLIIVELTTLAH